MPEMSKPFFGKGRDSGVYCFLRFYTHTQHTVIYWLDGCCNVQQFRGSCQMTTASRAGGVKKPARKRKDILP